MEMMPLMQFFFSDALDAGENIVANHGHFFFGWFGSKTTIVAFGAGLLLVPQHPPATDCASALEYGTYRIRLRRACGSMQSCQSLHTARTHTGTT